MVSNSADKVNIKQSCGSLSFGRKCEPNDFKASEKLLFWPGYSGTFRGLRQRNSFPFSNWPAPFPIQRLKPTRLLSLAVDYNGFPTAQSFAEGIKTLYHHSFGERWAPTDFTGQHERLLFIHTEENKTITKQIAILNVKRENNRTNWFNLTNIIFLTSIFWRETLLFLRVPVCFLGHYNYENYKKALERRHKCHR